MRFFFDRNMPPMLSDLVRVANVDASIKMKHHNEDPRFSETTKDTEWIAALGSDGNPAWVVLSHDGRILRNAVERKALSEANLTFFYLKKAWLHTPLQDKAWKFLKMWPEIVKCAQACAQTPTIFEVPINSSRIDRVETTRR